MILPHATIREVASRANVSTATVSRILNGKAGHRQSTIDSIRRTVSELDREAELNAAAVQAPECIGIVMSACRDFLNTSYNSTLLTAILETFASEGYVAQLIARTATQMNIEFFRNMVRAYRLKGLIIPEFDALYAISRELKALEIPVISIGNVNGAELRYNIHVDDFAAGRDAAIYLWSLGHRRFGFLSMSLLDICQRQRLTGFTEAIRELGGGYSSIWIKEFRNLADSTTLAALEFSRLDERPGAVFSTNSFMTQKFLADLHRLNLETPEDFSLVSFEENGELEHLPTPVTVMAQPTRDMGTSAATMLLRLLSGYTVEARRQLNCSLNIRESTRPARRQYATSSYEGHII